MYLEQTCFSIYWEPALIVLQEYAFFLHPQPDQKSHKADEKLNSLRDAKFDDGEHFFSRYYYE